MSAPAYSPPAIGYEGHYHQFYHPSYDPECNNTLKKFAYFPVCGFFIGPARLMQAFDSSSYFSRDRDHKIRGVIETIGLGFLLIPFDLIQTHDWIVKYEKPFFGESTENKSDGSCFSCFSRCFKKKEETQEEDCRLLPLQKGRIEIIDGVQYQLVDSGTPSDEASIIEELSVKENG